MYDHDNLKCMIKCLEEHKYDYTKYEHRNGKCSIRTDLLLKQLKLDEQETRNKAIDEFAERMKDKWIDTWDLNLFSSFREFVDEIAEQMKGGV